jgi:hypothetical protein
MSHESQFEVFWVVQLIARYHSAIFSASANLFNKYFALLTIIVMAPLSALMSVAWKELLAGALTHRDLVGALPPLFTEESDDLSATTGAVLDPCWSLLAWLACALMTHLLASVLPTIQRLSAEVVAHELLASAFNRFLTSFTETLHFNVYFALLALS